MVERKYIKVRTDMYSDTKFKIIDTMEDRDLIHYIWTRLLTLAGKVNLEGALYMSKTIPYTIETLAIEFNRSVSKVKLALKIFKDLEMIELDENNVYKVKNFAKHQNIKSKKNVEKSDNEKKSNDKTNIEKLAHKNNGQVKNEEYKAKEIKDFKNNERAIYEDDERVIREDNEKAICKNNENRICKDLNERTVFKDSESIIHEDNEKERKASLKDTNKKEQNENLCENKLKNDKCKVKEFKNTSEKESYGNNDGIVNKNNNDNEKTNMLLNCSNETTKKESKDIDFHIDLTCNNNEKKSKKSRKKSEEIEEVCFEEDIEDITAPMEYNDEPILNGKVIKEFKF